MTEITVEIVKLVNGGQGLGFYEGKPVFAWNALPGETAVIKLTKEKKDYFEGIAVDIKNSSPERVVPKEEHYLSCSPWQIMTFAHENHWKKKIAKETFKKIGGIELPDLAIVHDENLFGYRNKIEYGFCDAENGGLVFAFHKRASTELRPIDKCLLAKANINKAAVKILDRLNRAGVAGGDLKSLVLRENSKGQVVASLSVINKNFKLPQDNCRHDILAGFHVYFAGPGNLKPKLLHSEGCVFLNEELAGKTLKCGPLSFFQVNIGIFEKTISRISTFVGEDDDIVDFYSGVGSIGITLGDKVKSGILVESDNEASKLAGENIKSNKLRNLAAHAGSAENRLSEIKEDKTIIFDPPRAGLHPKVVGKVLEIFPHRVVYLSCDVATHARDLKALSGQYEVKFCELYNFFPRTPHIESLVVLESN